METKIKRILIVDDDRDAVDFLTECLTRDGHSISHALDGEAALHRVRAWKPHLVLLDVNLPGMSGIDLVPRIREATQDDYAAIILVSASGSAEDVHNGLEAGADDYLIKPFRAQDLSVRMRILIRIKELQDSLRRAQHRVEELSTHDDLTGLLNFRALQRRGDEELQRSRRFRKPVSGLVVNVDGFSGVNELVGFVKGSQVLKEVALRIQKSVRTIDLICRVGADEFFVLLPETDLAGAEFVAERVRDSVETAPFNSDKSSVPVTVCVGIAGFAEGQADRGLVDLFKNAQEALRSAKSAGPNRVEMYSFA